jgi:hypothetical protein
MVMRPIKEDLFKAVFAEVASLNPDAEFSKRDILSILAEIKERRILFKNSKDYDKEIETYRVIEGPIKTVVGANKLGKIYRYS